MEQERQSPEPCDVGVGEGKAWTERRVGALVPPGAFRVRGPLCPVSSVVRDNQTSHVKRRVGKKGASVKASHPPSVLAMQMSHPVELMACPKPLLP